MLLRAQTHFIRIGILLLTMAFAVTSHAAKKSKKSKPTVAVLYFDYAGNDPDMAILKKGLANMLITDLVEVDGLQVVERARLQELLGELKLNKTKTIDRRKAVEIGKMAGALYIVMGHYLLFGEKLLIEARLLNTSTSVYVGKFKARVKGHADDFFELQQGLSEQLQEKLVETLPTLASFKNRRLIARLKRRVNEGSRQIPKVAGIKSPTESAPAATESENDQGSSTADAHSKTLTTRLPYRLALAYAKALDAKDRGDIKSARTLLKKVLKQAPGFQLAHTELANLN